MVNKTIVTVKVVNWNSSNKLPDINLCEYCATLLARDWKGWSNWGTSAVLEITKK